MSEDRPIVDEELAALLALDALEPDEQADAELRLGTFPAELSGATATILIGELGTAASPARHDTPLTGIDLDFSGGTAELPLRPEWEYALIVLRGAAELTALDGRMIVPGHLAYLGEHRDELIVRGDRGTRAVLLGGEPFGERILMWWNFVARTVDEFVAARDSWQQADQRFGAVASRLPRIPAPAPYWPSR